MQLCMQARMYVSVLKGYKRYYEKPEFNTMHTHMSL